MKISTSRPIRTLNRAQQIWAELDYAQRRLFELRTGVPAVSRQNRRDGSQRHRD